VEHHPFVEISLNDDESAEGESTIKPSSARLRGAPFNQSNASPVARRPTLPAEWIVESITEGSQSPVCRGSVPSEEGQSSPRSSGASWVTVTGSGRSSLASPGFSSPLRHSFTPEEVASPPRDSFAKPHTKTTTFATLDTTTNTTGHGNKKRFEDIKANGDHFILMPKDPDMIVAETGKPLHSMTDEQFCGK
jgi:hypothetical protein